MKRKKKIIFFIAYSILVIIIAGGIGYAIPAYRWKPIHERERDDIERLEKEAQEKSKEQAKWNVPIEQVVCVYINGTLDFVV